MQRHAATCSRKAPSEHDGAAARIRLRAETELAPIRDHLTKIDAAIDRYVAAFENWLGRRDMGRGFGWPWKTDRREQRSAQIRSFQ